MSCKDCYLNHNCKKYINNGEQDSDLCMRFYKLDFLFNNSLLSQSQRYSKCLILDADNRDQLAFDKLSNIRKNIVKFVGEGNNLYIYSAIPGNGKTSWAIKLLQEFLYKVWPESEMRCRVLFINVPKFLLELKSNISNHSEYIEFIYNNINIADIVVWDDIGTKAATEFEHEHLLSLIDSRMFNGKSNIFTSNIKPNDLSTLLGDRLSSRIINNSETVEFNGVDKRGLHIGIDLGKEIK